MVKNTFSAEKKDLIVWYFRRSISGEDIKIQEINSTLSSKRCQQRGAPFKIFFCTSPQNRYQTGP
jgi:hypothetical protein